MKLKKCDWKFNTYNNYYFVTFWQTKFNLINLNQQNYNPLNLRPKSHQNYNKLNLLIEMDSYPQ